MTRGGPDGRRRKIVVSLSSIFPVRGGIPRFNQMLCLALDQLAPMRALEVVAISQDDTLEHYRSAGSPWKHVRFIPGGGRIGIIARTARICALERPDALLIGLLGMAPLGLLCSPFVRRGYTFVAHGMEAWAEPRLTRRLAARRARFVLAVSQDTATKLTRSTGVAPSRIRLLPNTLDLGLEAASDGADGIEDPARLELLTVARLWAEERLKGVDHTLQAVARLATPFPGLRYRIIGKGSDKPRLMKLAASLGIVDRVVFEEDLDDAALADRYRRCSAFVLPSGQEGFGIVFLEAMRFRKPAVGALVGGIPEVVEDGRTGLLVPFGDVDALAEALRRLLSDSSLRQAMGEAGRRRVDTLFSFARFRDRVDSFLQEWIG